MIDSDLRYPYLIRNYLNRVVGFNEDARKTLDIGDFYQEKKKKTNENDIVDYGLQLNENYGSQNSSEIENDYRQELNKFERKKKTTFNYDEYESYLEIDYQYFEQKFWNPLLTKHHYKVTCNLVWTQIYSVIKGSREHWLMEYEYQVVEKNLSQKQKKTIFQIFSEYEIFKRRIGAFDLMDVILHIFKQMEYVNLKILYHIYFI